MPVYRIGEELAFPPASFAEPDGLLGVGGDLRPERLLLAYAQGIFPWYDESLPILWYSPDPRLVLEPKNLRVSRRLAKTVRQHRFEVTLDRAFERVIRACASNPRREGNGTWITPAMIEGFCRLHEQGFAHSVEAWREGELVGGLYGLSLGAMFFGESMFHRETDASKVAFVTLVHQLERWEFHCVDCQVHTEHLVSLGAVPWPRERFLHALRSALEAPTRVGSWELT